MPPRMMTRSAGRATATPRGGRTGGRTGRGGGKTIGRSSDQGNGRIDSQGSQVGGQGSEVNDGVDEVPDFSTIIAQQNQNDDAVNENILGDVRNVIANNNRRGCTYKEFLAYNPKEYDGKGGAIVYTRWIEKMESVQDMSGYPHTKPRSGCWFNELARLVPHLVTLEKKRIERYIYGLASQIQRMVAATELEWINKNNPEKRGNSGEPSRYRSVRDDNKKTRTGNAFATTTNPVRRENTGHLLKDCRVVPRNVNPVNTRNPTATRGGCGNNGNLTRGRAFMLGAEEARQDPNIVTGIMPSDLGFSYKIYIASRQLVEINKVIKGCKLKIEGHEFDISLIPFGNRSFDVIIGIDWLSNHKAEIICHEKVVRIPLLDGKVLRVLGERPEEK
ncbi:reverse transcriptase domain-containing protein [Tanacetum coccineum]